MKQYNAIKAKHPGALLLFRVGDFYETFGEDAITASKVLDIVLTKRANGAAAKIALAGFPHHSLDTYLPKLVRAGHRVAICDQLEDPKLAKGIVKRGITELVTPGLSFHDQVLDKAHNNYLAAIYFTQNELGISFLDVSTGEFLISQGSKDYLDRLLQNFRPVEVIFSKAYREQFQQGFKANDTIGFHAYALEDWIFSFDYGYEKLTEQFNTSNLKGFGIEQFQEGIIAAGAILHYLEYTEHKNQKHISSVARIEEEKYVWLDKFTVRNLELLHAQQDGAVPLLQVLDQTVTPMGGRLLKKWMVLPLKEKSLIDQRLQLVATLVKNQELLDEVLGYLSQIGDLERLISKVAVARINPREMQLLKKAMQFTLPLKEALQNSGIKSLQNLAGTLDPCEVFLNRIEQELHEDPPLATHQGNLIKDGVNQELDELRAIAYSGKDYLLQLQKTEAQATGIASLKIAYNKVFGYYLEVTNAHKDKVPESWIRKQTLVNAERYITEELKTYEEKILGAEEKLGALEQGLFDALILEAMDFVTPIQQNARLIAKLDVLCSFATTALKNHYVQPEITEKHAIDIKNGRHPVIEKQLPLGEPYIPNDVYLDDQEQQIIIITGPNMAGKSAILRQTALIVLMAQMGSFVPAQQATLGIIDKVFTRVGASDNLSQGESTFMVEMTETASILNNLSDRSLVLMDEIGRGTSTYDGISIAWAIVEHLHNSDKCKAKTLFATHYHELNQLTNDLTRVKNYNVSVKEVGNKVIFMRKLEPGGSEHSFGIHVAQMAGMPNQIVIRAHQIMRHLEKDKLSQHDKSDFTPPPEIAQLTLFEADPQFKKVQSLLSQLDINTISPVEALLKLNEIKMILEESKTGLK